MGIPKGTKLTDNPKNITLKVRFDEKTSAILETVCQKTGKTKAQVIRDGINQQYAALEKE